MKRHQPVLTGCIQISKARLVSIVKNVDSGEKVKDWCSLRILTFCNKEKKQYSPKAYSINTGMALSGKIALIHLGLGSWLGQYY
jgi:hypothetical protein